MRNLNDFKKVPGFGGVLTNSVGDPIPGVTVTVTVGSKTNSATTNDQGFYLISYKTGKAQGYTLIIQGYKTFTGTINANKFVVNNWKAT